MSNIIHRVVCDDWEVLYGTDGKMISEGHAIPWDIWFKTGQENPEAEILIIYLSEDVQELYEVWDFPYNFYDLPIEIQNLYE